MSISDDAVREALQKARYNETVHITVNNKGDDDGSADEIAVICLIPCLNEQQGGVQFNNLVSLVPSSTDSADASSPCWDQEIVLARELRTNRWFFPMLNDQRRNELYQKAIQAASQEFVNRCRTNKQCDALANGSNNADVAPIRVLDIGSGTGLLAMMAAQSLKRHSAVPIQITSMEMSSAFAVLANRTIHDNGLDDIITVREGHSTAATVVGMDQDSHRADICLSELLDDGLLGEGWLPTMRDAWERHLKPDAVVIPQRARVFAVLVEADWLPNYAGPYSRAVSENLDGLSSDQKPLNAAASHQHRVSLAVDSDETEPLIGAEHVVLPMHAEKLIRDQRLRVISAAVELFDFDVTRGDRIPGRDGRQRTVHLTVSATPKTTTTDDVSEIHGALVWWELELLDGICYSTEPGKEPWQDHWRPCLHLFHSSKKVKAGECVQVKVKHNDTRLFLNIVTSNDGIDNNEEADPASKRTKADNLQTTAYISPERAFQLNDDERYSIYYNAIDSALSIYRANDDDNCQSNGNIAAAVVLDVSDFSLGACIAAALGGARRIVSLEGSSGRLPMTAARVAQLGNKIASVPGQLDFEILQCYAEQLTLDLLGGTPADILLAEPYYEILEGWHLQEAMNLYYTVRMLRSNGLVSEKSIVIPSECRIMGCIIESNQIRSAYRACGDHNATTKDESICGLDHSFVNEIGSRFNEYDLSLPLWQFDYNVLSDVIELGNLAYCDPTAPPFVEPIVARAGFHTAGRCDALLVWLEYFFPASHRLATTRKTADYQQTSQPKTASEPSRSNEITTHLEPNARSVESSAVTQVRTNVLTSNNQAHRQIVHILKDTIVVGETGKAEFICTSRFGGITGLEDHQFDVRIQYLDS